MRPSSPTNATSSMMKVLSYQGGRLETVLLPILVTAANIRTGNSSSDDCNEDFAKRLAKGGNNKTAKKASKKNQKNAVFTPVNDDQVR